MSMSEIMVQKEFTFRGKKLEELKAMSIPEFIKLIPANERRHLKRGLTVAEKALMRKLEAGKNNIETHARETVIIPMMVGKILKIHNGKEFTIVTITEDMLGHRLGEFALTRRIVKHGTAGVGATKGTASKAVH